MEDVNAGNEDDEVARVKRVESDFSRGWWRNESGI